MVRKGDLLISGIYDSYPWGYRYVRARGIIMARTVKKIAIEIPLNYQEKVYTGESETQNSVNFFSNEIKLYRKTRFLGATYDTIYIEKEFQLPRSIALPIKWNSITFLEYTYEPRTRTAQEAMDLAYMQLDEQVDRLIDTGGVVLRKDIFGEVGDSQYLLECTLVIIQNIAETKEFEIAE